MNPLNYIYNNSILNNFSKAFTVGCLAVASCLVGSAAQAAKPDSNWSVDFTVNDCFYPQDYSDSSCQNYQEDLYENWYSNVQGDGDTDIKTFSVGADDKYFYFEIDLSENWDYDNDGESRQYYLEIEADGDSQSDYFLVYQPKREDLSATWKNMGGTGEVEVYQDSNNDIGGNDPTAPDNGNSDGYESELGSSKNLSSGDFYVRLVNGNVQMALKKNKIGSPSNILTRAYAAQNTNLEATKLTWHDYNDETDLDGSGGFDSTAGADTSTWLLYHPAPTNSLPVTANDTATTYVKQTVTINVLSNDSDPDLDPLTVTQVGTPVSTDPNNTDVGTASIDANGDIIYVAGDQGGIYTIEYTVSDPVGATQTGTLEITVENRVPITGSDSAETYIKETITVDVLSNDSDPDSVTSPTNPINNILTITKLDGNPIVNGDDNVVAGGTATVDANGNIVYTAGSNHGTYTIEYTVSDSGDETSIGTLTITVNPYLVD